MGVDSHTSLSDEVTQMRMHIGVISNSLDDTQKNFKEISIPTVVEGIEILFDILHFHQIDNSL